MKKSDFFYLDEILENMPKIKPMAKKEIKVYRVNELLIFTHKKKGSITFTQVEPNGFHYAPLEDLPLMRWKAEKIALYHFFETEILLISFYNAAFEGLEEAHQKDMAALDRELEEAKKKK